MAGDKGAEATGDIKPFLREPDKAVLKDLEKRQDLRTQYSKRGSSSAFKDALERARESVGRRLRRNNQSVPGEFQQEKVNIVAPETATKSEE